jgi:hypothetical protein
MNLCTRYLPVVIYRMKYRYLLCEQEEGRGVGGAGGQPGGGDERG